MAWRLGRLFQSGELDNTQHGWTTGWLQLEGFSDRLQIKLAGNCHPDLAGWKFRIQRVEPEFSAENCECDPAFDYFTINVNQSGHVGDITADQMIKHHEIPEDELVRRLSAGERPPFTWRKCFYMEWFGNACGRVVIQSTRLEVERLGEQAFVLTEEEWIEQKRRNSEELSHFMAQLGDALQTIDPEEEA